MYASATLLTRGHHYHSLSPLSFFIPVGPCLSSMPGDFIDRFHFHRQICRMTHTLVSSHAIVLRNVNKACYQLHRAVLRNNTPDGR